MNLREYEDWVRARWEDQTGIDFAGACQIKLRPHEERVVAIAALGLGGEAGEATEHFKKKIRDDKFDVDEVRLELGDLLHYLTVLAWMTGVRLETIADANVSKLDNRDKTKIFGT